MNWVGSFHRNWTVWVICRWWLWTRMISWDRPNPSVRCPRWGPPPLLAGTLSVTASPRWYVPAVHCAVRMPTRCAIPVTGMAIYSGIITNEKIVCRSPMIWDLIRSPSPSKESATNTDGHRPPKYHRITRLHTKMISSPHPQWAVSLLVVDDSGFVQMYSNVHLGTR